MQRASSLSPKYQLQPTVHGVFNLSAERCLDIVTVTTNLL